MHKDLAIFNRLLICTSSCCAVLDIALTKRHNRSYPTKNEVKEYCMSDAPTDHNPAPMDSLLQAQPGADGLEFPPKIILDMEGDLFDYVEGKSLRGRFPVKERYQNPAGHMQGGMIVAAIDNTIGPLSFIAGQPNATTQLNTSFIRPVTRDEAYIDVEAVVLERTRRHIYLSAQVTNAAGKIIATATATCQIVGE